MSEEDERPLLAPTASEINNDYDSDEAQYPVKKTKPKEAHGTVMTSIFNLANGGSFVFDDDELTV